MLNNYIVLNPKQVQKLLDWIEITPSEHYLCIFEDDTSRLYVSDLVEGENGWIEGEKFELTEDEIQN